MALVAPAEKDGFSYAGDSLYCEASNHNRHRRATLPELKAHFNGKDTENRPAHWYEAQLLHYGLPPSKVKGTAHKRLFDAVTKGGLAVPAHIQKTETDLKKEWTKKEREAKKVLKESASAPSSGKGTKRKADQAQASTNVSVNVSVQITSTGSVKVQTAQPAAKKAKTAKTATTAARKPTSIKSAATAPAPKTKKTPPAKPTATKAAANDKKTTKAAPKTPKAGGKAAPATKPTKTLAEPKVSPKKQTSQRPVPSSSSNAGTSMFAFRGGSANHEDVPPPYSEFDTGHNFNSQGRQLSSSQQRSSQRRIGLLNGRYEVSCPYIDDNFPEREFDLGLIATLDGDTLWLTFDFGIVTGTMQVERPYEPDAEAGMQVFWRGHAFGRHAKIDTFFRAGPVNKLWFLGEGHIRGKLHYGGPSAAEPLAFQFDAYRVPGQSMTSEVSPARARAEWADLE